MSSHPISLLDHSQEINDFKVQTTPITVLERSYTLDKLIGPLSTQFLQRVPEAVTSSIEVSQLLRQSTCYNEAIHS